MSWNTKTQTNIYDDQQSNYFYPVMPDEIASISKYFNSIDREIEYINNDIKKFIMNNMDAPYTVAVQHTMSIETCRNVVRAYIRAGWNHVYIRNRLGDSLALPVFTISNIELKVRRSMIWHICKDTEEINSSNDYPKIIQPISPYEASLIAKKFNFIDDYIECINHAIKISIMSNNSTPFTVVHMNEVIPTEVCEKIAHMYVDDGWNHVYYYTGDSSDAVVSPQFIISNLELDAYDTGYAHVYKEV